MISPYASITNFIRFQPSPPKNKQNAHKKTRRIKHRQAKPYWIYQWLCKVNQPKLYYLKINTCHQKMAKPQKTHPRATHWKTKPTFQSPCFPMWSIQPDVPSAHGAVDTLPSQQSLEFAPRYLVVIGRVVGCVQEVGETVKHVISQPKIEYYTLIWEVKLNRSPDLYNIVRYII